jgi:hypothetical protein
MSSCLPWGWGGRIGLFNPSIGVDSTTSHLVLHCMHLLASSVLDISVWMVLILFEP